MSETSKSPSREFGVPFWIGYVVSLVGCFVLMAGLDILDLDDHLGFWVYVCVAFGVVAPFGGVILQVAHHVFLAVGQGQLRFWHIALLLAIVLTCLVAGYIYYLNGADGDTLWFFG
jgi:hypothetical protein